VAVLASVWIEVTDLEGLTRHATESLGVIEEASEDAGATLGRLVEKQHTALGWGWKGLGGELLVLELEHGLYSSLQRRL
jgi:hypothetical protein